MSENVIRGVAVIGAGQMGQGIAQIFAAARYRVSLSDATQVRATEAKNTIESRLAGLVKRGKLNQEDAEKTVEHISAASTDAALGNADLIVEAVSEEPSVKEEMFRKFDQLAPAHALLTSNTSSISISRLAGYTKRPELVAGMHFMNPVPKMSLVEVVQGLQTTEATLKTVCDVAQRLGKVVVRSQDRPGFIVNRVLIPLLNEACLTLQDGVASIEDIDQAVQLGLNHPMGPLRLCDLIGLDTVLAIAEVLHRDFADSKYRPAPLLRNMVAAGLLGVKSGQGFYVYEGHQPSGVTRLPGQFA